MTTIADEEQTEVLPPVRRNKLIPDTIYDLGTCASNLHTSTCRDMQNLPLGGSSRLRAHAIRELQVLREVKLDAVTDTKAGISMLPYHKLNLRFHEVLASVGNDGDTVAKVKTLISTALSVLGHLAQKDPCVLLKIPKSSDVSSEYHKLRDENEDLKLSVRQLTDKVDDQQRTIEQLNARIQQQEAELELARTNTVTVGVGAAGLLPSLEAIQALINKYADVKTFTSDDAEYIFGVLTFVSEELETLNGNGSGDPTTSARMLVQCPSTTNTPVTALSKQV